MTIEWFFFALLAPIFWALNNVFDKVILTKYFKNPISFQILLRLLYLVVLIPLALFVEISAPYPWNIISLVLGFISGFAVLLYLKAMSISEASRIVPLIYLNPLFVLPLAFIFLKEVLTAQKYIGIFFLVGSAILLSYQHVKSKSRNFYKALLLILIFDVWLAVAGVATKYLFGFINYWSFIFWNIIGFSLSVVISFAVSKWRKDFIKDIRSPRAKKGIILVFINLLFYLAGVIPLFIALQSQNVSLVSAVPTLQPLFVLIYTTGLTVFMPKILKEKVSKKIIGLKLIAIALIIVGTWLVVK